MASPMSAGGFSSSISFSSSLKSPQTMSYALPRFRSPIKINPRFIGPSLDKSCSYRVVTCAVANTERLAPKIDLHTGQDRVDILSEALPFIQKFQGKTVVVKYGGAAMKSEVLKDGVIKDLVLLSCVGLRPVFVHGGGPEINEWLGKVGIQPQFKNGLRVTDGPTMEVVEMVLVGKVNKSLVSLINRAGGNAVGLCGKDGKLITARPAGSDLGFVGEVADINTSVLKAIVGNGSIPVIASVAADNNGQAYNINADTVAGEIAASLGAEKLILLTDVAGLLLDRNNPQSLVKEVDIKGVKKLIEEGTVSGGMIPKVNCCIRSIAQGVRTASIIDGRLPHSLLFEILTDEGAGTMITGCTMAKRHIWLRPRILSSGVKFRSSFTQKNRFFHFISLNSAKSILGPFCDDA